MLNLEGENGQIIKIDTQSSFLDVREAFVFKEKNPDGSFRNKVVGKIQFLFRCYDKSRPAGYKITQKVDFYLSAEDASYLAEIMKTGRIRELCKSVRDRAAANGKSAAYSFGYIKYGGTALTKTSRQLKFQLSDDGRLWIKALEGPGIVESKGSIKPNYKDSEAANKVAIALSEEQTKKIGIAIERALRYFDTWAAMGTVESNVAAFRTRKTDDEDKIAEYIPAYS